MVVKCLLSATEVRPFVLQTRKKQKQFKKKLEDEHPEIEKRLGLSRLLEMFRKAQQIGESFDSILAQQAFFLFCYEQAVVFNYLGAHDRALSTNLRRQPSNQNISTNGRPAMSFILY